MPTMKIFASCWWRCCFLAMIFLAYVGYPYMFVWKWNVFRPENGDRKSSIKPGSILQVVHLDLKGAPPRMSYLVELLPRLVQVGVTGLLIEYEDMFPYEGPLKNISSTSPYSKTELSEFLDYCDVLGIEVIPLIQTFGHMEHVLKLEEFRHLREDPRDPRAICPSDPRSLVVIKEMIRQVLALHSFSKRIHIGCDEVFTLNKCSKCLQRRAWKTEIFLDHVRVIASFIRDEYDNKFSPLMWDDMIRWKPFDLVVKSNLPHLVEIVIWDYTPSLEIPTRIFIFDKYLFMFKKIWIAGAFKGADGSKAILPMMKNRHENHQAWMRLIESRAKKSDSIVGFVSTGWSRYDHFASLCELLPASIPSLMLNLLQVAKTLSPPRDIENDYNYLLECYPKQRGEQDAKLFIKDIYDLEKNGLYCSFPEYSFVAAAWELDKLRRKLDRIYDDLYEKNGWISEYHLRNNLLCSKMIVKEFASKNFNETYWQFRDAYDVIGKQLLKYYRNDTVEEWIGTYVDPYLKKLEILKSIIEKAGESDTWSRRGSLNNSN